MLKILHFIFGQLYFQVKGYQTERFLNLCAKNHLVLWELKPVSDGYVFFIRRSSYQMLEALAEKANVDLALLGQKGLPYFLKEHKKRKILFFSMCLCGLMILSLSQFLWEITVSGGEVYSESDILKYVTDNYYHIGTLKYQIDCDALEDHLREDYAEIAWASCSIQGTRLHIEIKETLDRKTKQNPKKPCDIVANKSGIITKMAVKSGTPLVSTGDSVKKGTTLISGLIYYYSDDFTVTQTDKIKADGEIVMRTKEEYNNSIHMEYYEKLITGKKKSIKNLYFGQYQFDFPEKKRQDHTNVMTKRRSLKIGKSFYLPIGITLQITERYRPKKKILTKKEAQLKLKKQLERYLMKKAKEKGVNLVLAIDAKIADDFSNDAKTAYADVNEIPDGWEGLDIGPKTIALYAEVIKNSKTILWNGPVGVFEMDKFATGSKAVAEAIAEATSKGAFSLIGGGDSVACINKFGLADKVGYVSTGGGALLEYIEGKELPGVAASRK